MLPSNKRPLEGTRGMKQIHQKHITMRIWATNSNIDHNLVAWTVIRVQGLMLNTDV